MSGKPKRLSEAHKVFVVQRLAMFDSPGETAKALSDEYGIQIAPQSVERYDPNKQAGKRLAKHLKTLFEETRKRFLEDLTDIPAANKAYRIRRLYRMSLQAEQRGNLVLAASLLEQIAKEAGNVFTNRKEHTGKGGGPIKHQDVTGMTEEQIDAELKELGYDPDVHEAPASIQ